MNMLKYFQGTTIAQ